MECKNEFARLISQQSSVFTNDLNKAREVSARIQAGAVRLNRGPGFRAGISHSLPSTG